MLGLIGRTISHYRILEQIGQGGMSSVFRATDLSDGRPVAVKILSPYIAHEERFQARFEREIKLLRQLQHPNIIPILDFGEADGVAFIVMPFVGSGTLLDLLNKGALDPGLGGRIVDQLASALTLAHQNGVVHRDIKPSNVLIDEQGNALLSDFSFARPQETSQNLTGSALIGTPAYMSPEQCRGDPIDARSDQYSFGIMLFQMTTGSLPFQGDTPMATALQHVNVPLPLPRQVNPNLPAGVELILIRALAKDPALRYESLEDLNHAFQAALAIALDPEARAAAGGKTVDANRTLAMYRKYQNVRPPNRRRQIERSVMLATLLLLLACTVSAGAVAIIRPEIFTGAAAAPRMSEAEIQATVEARMATALAGGTVMPTGALETEIYSAVLMAVEATRIAGGGPSSTPSLTPTPTVTSNGSQTATLPGARIPSRTPTRTRTLRPGETPPTPTWTPTPSATDATTSTPTASATGGPTSTLGPTATNTIPPTPTNTPVPPTATLAPTATPVPPTATTPPEPTINPQFCIKPTDHPQYRYCTPSP